MTNLPSASPQFWFGNDLAWSIIARVDGQTYNLFGVASPAAGSQSADVVSGSFTATHSVFVLSAGKASITLDFFSPVSFQDYVRQSLPFSYLTVSASGQQGATPSVQIYTDIDDTWTGQSTRSNSNFSASGDTSLYQVTAVGQPAYAESANEQALWGEAVFATSSSKSLTSASGSSASVRGDFQSRGALSDTHPNWSQSDVFAFASDLGSVSSKASVTFAIGYVREAAVNYLGAAQTGYYRSKYPDTPSAVAAFLDDYAGASIESSDLDSQIQTTGTSTGGQNYSEILQLSVLQTFGGIDVTIPSDALDTSKASAFIKEISSDGNVNTIDIIVELIPFFHIFNVEYLRLLLDPVVQYLESGRYPNPYAIHDIGASYPNALGHDDGQDEAMPVEETGNLLILAAVYQVASGNSAWASSHSKLFDSYAEYLVNNGLYPTNQLSTNDGLGPFTNMTQLGVKAAVGLSAYGQLTGTQKYTDSGNSFAKTIYTTGVGVEVSQATGQTYFTLTYGSSTYFLLYNLYPARLLGLTLFPDAAYDGQSALYATVRGPYGVPLDGDVEWGKSDWQMWSAAIASEGVRDEFINDLHAYMSNGKNTAPFADRYWAAGAQAGLSAAGFRARPVLGAHFAIWALEKKS